MKILSTSTFFLVNKMQYQLQQKSKMVNFLANVYIGVYTEVTKKLISHLANIAMSSLGFDTITEEYNYTLVKNAQTKIRH
jgi:hypothetical protein